jgi:predicted nicotinamide N-methyase
MNPVQYRMKKQLEKIGPFEISVECLDDLNETIDQVFQYLQSSGDPQALEELCPYFGVVWPAARGLSQFLATIPNEALYQKKVIELGCGLALPSMIATLRGADALATDFHPEVPRFLNQNIQTNGFHQLQYRAINWEKEKPDLDGYDWVIGSDILYERRYPDSLARTIRSLVKPLGKVIIADPGRPYLQNFVDSMKAQGFLYETQILKVPHPPTEQEVFVLKFKLT